MLKRVLTEIGSTVRASSRPHQKAADQAQGEEDDATEDAQTREVTL